MSDKSDWIGIWVEAKFFEPNVLKKVLTRGTFCEFPVEDPAAMMKAIFEMGGYSLSGKQGSKENTHGVWISRSVAKRTVEVMIPWRFIQFAMIGSAEEVREFGFKDEAPVPVKAAKSLGH
jgi:hypothetical protein